MSEPDQKPSITDEQGGFVSRWSRLKQASLHESKSNAVETTEDVTLQVQAPQLCDEDMPPIESLTEESDYSGFFSEKVSEALRQQALRKLFHGASFNVCDGLDDYAEDFTSFAKLGSIITSDMRHQMAVAKEKLESALKSESTDEITPEAKVVAAEMDSEREVERDEQDQEETGNLLVQKTAADSEFNHPMAVNQIEAEGGTDS